MLGRAVSPAPVATRPDTAGPTWRPADAIYVSSGAFRLEPAATPAGRTAGGEAFVEPDGRLKEASFGRTASAAAIAGVATASSELERFLVDAASDGRGLYAVFSSEA